ncbi:helix-turn-helix transcriptional regulator [Azotobacter vinelandii]
MSKASQTPFKPIERIALGNRLLRLPDVESKTGKSKQAIYAAIRAGTFPAPVPIGRNSVAWLEAEVDQWIADRLTDRARNRAQRKNQPHNPAGKKTA